MTECSSFTTFLAWKSSWLFSWENGLHVHVVAAFMISWLAKQPKCYIVLWLTKKIDWSERVVLWPKLMIDYLWKDWLNQLTEWRITDYSTAFQMTSSSFVILVDYMSVLFYFFYSETVGCISNLSCFSTPPLKKKGRNEKIPEKWLNWIVPYWCGRDYYWVPFISKSWWYKFYQIS